MKRLSRSYRVPGTFWEGSCVVPLRVPEVSCKVPIWLWQGSYKVTICTTDYATRPLLVHFIHCCKLFYSAWKTWVALYGIAVSWCSDDKTRNVGAVGSFHNTMIWCLIAISNCTRWWLISYGTGMVCLGR